MVIELVSFEFLGV